MAYNAKKYWSARENPNSSPHIQHIERHIVPIFLSGVTSMLDFGVGTGRLFELYPGGSVVGMDFVDTYKDRAIKQAQRMNLNYFHCGYNPGEALPFENKYFDRAIASKVLLHIPHPEGIIAELARVAGKVLIIDTWNENQKAKHVFVHNYKKILNEYNISFYTRIDDHLTIIYEEK